MTVKKRKIWRRCVWSTSRDGFAVEDSRVLEAPWTAVVRQRACRLSMGSDPFVLLSQCDRIIGMLRIHDQCLLTRVDYQIHGLQRKNTK